MLWGAPCWQRQVGQGLHPTVPTAEPGGWAGASAAGPGQGGERDEQDSQGEGRRLWDLLTLSLA